MENIYRLIISGLFFLFGLFPIKKNKIVVSSYLGLGYGDNGKYIAEELINRKHDYDIVWLSKNENDTFPLGVRKVSYKSLKSIYEQSTAYIWIDNRRKPLYVRKRKNQIYINTWHGYMGIKKLEQDVEANLSDIYVKEAKHDSQMIDYFISGSIWETHCISRAFWYTGTILECGYPRSDILFHDFDSTKIKKIYNIDREDKILLYAPTFRHELSEKSMRIYNLNWKKVLDALSSKFGGHWVGMIRLHPNLFAISNKLNIPSEVINVTSYDDMQELIASCDCLITDYSSTIMDAGIANKVGFIYATDFYDYQKDRDVYFNIKDDLPFAFSESTEELIENIMHYEESVYKSRISTFFNEIYGVYRKGNASKYICDIIDEQMAK